MHKRTQLLIQLRAECGTVRELAGRMGLTVDHVQKQIAKHGLPRYPVGQWKKGFASECRAASTSLQEMACKMGVTVEAVRLAIKRYDLPPFPSAYHRNSEELQSHVIHKYLTRVPMALIAHEHQISKGKVAGILNRAGAFRFQKES